MFSSLLFRGSTGIILHNCKVPEFIRIWKGKQIQEYETETFDNQNHMTDFGKGICISKRKKFHVSIIMDPQSFLYLNPPLIFHCGNFRIV